MDSCGLCWILAVSGGFWWESDGSTGSDGSDKSLLWVLVFFLVWWILMNSCWFWWILVGISWL
jgi:hypothetical protein